MTTKAEQDALSEIREAWVQWSSWKRVPTCGRAQAEAEFDKRMAARASELEEIEAEKARAWDVLVQHPVFDDIEEFARIQALGMWRKLDYLSMAAAVTRLKVEASDRPALPVRERIAAVIQGVDQAKFATGEGEYPTDLDYADALIAAGHVVSPQHVMWGAKERGEDFVWDQYASEDAARAGLDASQGEVLAYQLRGPWVEVADDA